jgi:hypothetical protein
MSKEASRWESSRGRALALLSILALTWTPLGTSQRTQSESIRFLVVLNEAQTDISPRGVNLSNCALILPDGRFHLERRVQQLPSHSATLEVFESSLDSLQFRQLQEILNDARVKELPAFLWPTTEMMGSKFQAFEARIARGDEVQRAGYFVRRGAPVGEAQNSTPSGVRKEWEQSEAVLRPVLQWLRGLETSTLQPSGGRSTLCSTDAHQ